MVLKGMTGKELAVKLGISETTLYRKMANDGDFSRKEIDDIMAILSIDDPVAIFFASELA
jgi:DNA-binding phage protein